MHTQAISGIYHARLQFSFELHNRILYYITINLLLYINLHDLNGRVLVGYRAMTTHL